MTGDSGDSWEVFHGDDLTVEVSDAPDYRRVFVTSVLASGHWRARIAFIERDRCPEQWTVAIRPVDETKDPSQCPALTAREIRAAPAHLLKRVRLAIDRDADPRLAFLWNEPQQPLKGRPTTATDADHAILAWAFFKACETSTKPWVALAKATGIPALHLKGWGSEATRNGFRKRSGRPGIPSSELPEETIKLLNDLGYDLEKNDPVKALVASERVLVQKGLTLPA